MELMIVVAIISILAAIAYPSYLDKVRRSRRVDAKSLVLKAANREEQLYSANNRYLDSMADLGLNTTSENGYYQVSLKTTGTNSQGYLITATALKDQVNDTCTTYTINEKGVKTATNAAGSDVTATCW